MTAAEACEDRVVSGVTRVVSGVAHLVLFQSYTRRAPSKRTSGSSSRILAHCAFFGQAVEFDV